MNIDDTRAAILWFSEKVFLDLIFLENLKTVDELGRPNNISIFFFRFFIFFWFFSWWIGEENTFFLDQLKVFCGLVFFHDF